jgi:hypothetical protein
MIPLPGLFVTPATTAWVPNWNLVLISGDSSGLSINTKARAVDNITNQYIPSASTHPLSFYTMSVMEQLWLSEPPPVSKLARYRTLSPLAGVRVSPIQLGAMSIGDKWHEFGMGSMDKESSFKLLDAYFDLGVGQTLLFLVILY